jgi:magnesium transporter
MIRAFYRSGAGQVTLDLPATDWRTALNDPRGVLWVDFDAAPPVEVEPLLRDTFGFHVLAIDDALCQTHVPKIDDWGDYIYAVVHSVIFNLASLAVRTRELDIFLGLNYLVTYHYQPIDAVERLWRHVDQDRRQLERGPDYLLYLLLDVLTAAYMPTLDALDNALDDLETTVFMQPTPQTLGTIFAVKRAALHLRRIIGPQREVLNKVARDDYAVIDPKDRMFFRDVYDHLVRLVDLNETLRELTSGTLDIYLSVSSNRINDVMKTLTIISAFFMPISFVVGFFGMNFSGLPFDSPWLLAGALGVIVMTPLLMLYWFARRGWLSPSETQSWKHVLAPEATSEASLCHRGRSLRDVTSLGIEGSLKHLGHNSCKAPREMDRSKSSRPTEET